MSFFVDSLKRAIDSEKEQTQQSVNNAVKQIEYNTVQLVIRGNNRDGKEIAVQEWSAVAHNVIGNLLTDFHYDNPEAISVGVFVAYPDPDVIELKRDIADLLFGHVGAKEAQELAHLLFISFNIKRIMSVLVLGLCLFLSSHAQAHFGDQNISQKEIIQLQDMVFYQKHEPVEYLDIEVSRWLNQWNALFRAREQAWDVMFDNLRKKAELSRLNVQLSEQEQWKDLRLATGLAVILLGLFCLFLTIGKAHDEERKTLGI